VARLLAEKGAVVYGADEAAHDLMKPGRAAWKRIVARFGRTILRPDRTIDRAALGAIVFADAKARRDLNGIVHPRVLADQDRTFRRVARAGRSRLFVVEAALAIEAGHADRFDRIVVVHCRRADQIRRLRERDGFTRAEALRRIGAQMPLGEKRRHADYVVDASGTLSQTVEETEKLYAQLMRDAELKPGSNQKPR
jgi:dephospho-CoA kinase